MAHFYICLSFNTITIFSSLIFLFFHYLLNCCNKCHIILRFPTTKVLGGGRRWSLGLLHTFGRRLCCLKPKTSSLTIQSMAPSCALLSETKMYTLIQNSHANIFTKKNFFKSFKKQLGIFYSLIATILTTFPLH